jgi:hypothetical protein
MRLRMFNGGFVCCSMRLGAPFIAPRQLGALGAQFGRQILPSVRRCTGLSGVHWTVNSTSTGRGRESPDWLVSFFVGHGTVRCTLWPLALVDVEHQTVRRLAQTVRWFIADEARENPESDELHRPCTRLSGERRQTVWCCAVSTFSWILCLSSFDSFGLYLAESLTLKQECLAYKTID